MFENLKKNCLETVKLNEVELSLIDKYFEEKILNKKEFLLKENSICDFIGFVANGCIRHYHVKDGQDKTCDISFENTWITEFASFSLNSLSIINLQALEKSQIFIIKKSNLYDLYKESSKYETFGRLMAEKVAQRATEIAMSLSSDKPEERFHKLLNKQQEIFQRVPQKFIASFLGISPESLSRIQKRIHNKLKS